MFGLGTSYCWCRPRGQEFVPYFSQGGPPVYCGSPELVLGLGLSEYDPSAWRLFSDTSKRSLNGVLPHNGNVFGSVPVAHLVLLKETYGSQNTFILDQVPGTQLASLWRFQNFSYVIGSMIWIHHVSILYVWVGQHSATSSLDAEGLAVSRKYGRQCEKYCTPKSCCSF
jgi:hypothetical protein